MPAKNEPLFDAPIFTAANSTVAAAEGVQEVPISEFQIVPAEFQQFCQANGISNGSEQSAALQGFLKSQFEKRRLALDFRSEPYGAPPANSEA